MSDTLRLRKKLVFDTVFGAPSVSQPTPVVTPATSFTAPGEVFGVPTRSLHDHQPAPSDGPIRSPLAESDDVRDQVRWDRSWHNVTHNLIIPSVPKQLNALGSPTPQTPDSTFKESLKDLLYPEARLPLVSHIEDIVIWHTNQVQLHFLHQILPILLAFSNDHRPGKLLFQCVKVLERSYRLYLHGLSLIVEELEANEFGSTKEIVQRFRRDLDAIVSHSVTNSTCF